MRHDETMFARWIWTPRTAASAVESAYALQAFGARRKASHVGEAFIAGLVLGLLVGVVL